MPSSHIHRTTSELNMLLGERQATKREEAMFQRVVGGLVNYHSDSQITVSAKGTAKKHTVEVSTTSIPRPNSTGSANQYSLKQARDASRSLLSSVTTGTEKGTKVAPSSSQSSIAHDDAPPSCRTERDEFFVGSFRDYAKLTPPNLLKLQEAALGIDRPSHANNYQRRRSDMTSDRNSEVVDASGDCSDDDELFALDL